MKKATILVAEDEKLQRETLAGALRGSGYVVLEARDCEGAVALLKDADVDVVITDLRMPGSSGLDLLREARRIDPDVAVVVATAFATVATAVEAMKSGAVDYLTKPIDLDELDLVVARILDGRALVRENLTLRRRLEEVTAASTLIGRSDGLQAIIALAARAAETDATVLILGESGTGKELLARSIHNLSRRAERSFVAVNCAALPETLLESEMFGHEKGAFTDARARRAGRVESAEGGTLFLDEIGDLTPQVQVKLLRFLESREFARLGGQENLRADVRVIAATHRDLEARMRGGLFRDDLYYRLNVVTLTLPPLRERREDIPELIEHFLVRFAKRYDRPLRGVSHDAMEALGAYPFPGNVRELENAIEQATVLASGTRLELGDLPTKIHCTGRDQAGAREEMWTPRPEELRGDLPGFLEDLEFRIILRTLAGHEGNQSSAARSLGLTESGLRYKLKRRANSRR